VGNYSAGPDSDRRVLEDMAQKIVALAKAKEKSSGAMVKQEPARESNLGTSDQDSALRTEDLNQRAYASEVERRVSSASSTGSKASDYEEQLQIVTSYINSPTSSLKR
jgi:hypothetical protein